MKHFIVVTISYILFPLTIQAQMRTVMGMRHDDDTLAVKYTKEMLQGKLWEFNIPEGVEIDGYAYIEFKGDSLFQTFVLEGKKYVFPCVYYLSDSYQMDFNDERVGANQTGKYIQVKYLDANCDGTGKTREDSFWIKKLTNDTLEFVKWKFRKRTERYHAKPIQEQ